MPIRFYEYEKCSTCRTARKWLDARGIAYQRIPIRENPPTEAELGEMLRAHGGDLRRLFNTSGGDYKAMHLKERLSELKDTEALELLSMHGNLVKRPFLLGNGHALIGFKPEIWEQSFG